MLAVQYFAIFLVLSSSCTWWSANGEFIAIGSTTTTRTKTFYTNFEPDDASCGDIELPWVDVLEFCEAHNMKGARVENAIENRLVTDVMKPTADCSHVFIAATDLDDQGNWYWLNGKPLQYSNFSEISNFTGNSCASIHVHEDGEWHDEECLYTVRPLCQTFETSYVAPVSKIAQAENFTSIGSVMETITKTFHADLEAEGEPCSLTEMTWFETVKFCEYHGMDIARTDNLEEIEQVIKVFNESPWRDCSHFWLSGTTFGNNGEWYWFNPGPDGTRDLTFTNWDSGEPWNSTAFDCMTEYEDGTWHTRPCGEAMRPLCQKIEKVQIVMH